MLQGTVPALFGGAKFVPVASAATGNDANTMALLHFDFSTLHRDDAAGHPNRVWSNANVTMNVGMFNNCGAFNGSTSGMSTTHTTDLQPTGDFTVDFWFYTAAPAGSQGVGGLFKPAGNFAAWLFYVSANNLLFFSSSDGINWDIANGKVIGAIAGNTFYHAAVTRQGNTWRTFLDGVAGATWTTALNPFNCAGGILMLGNQHGVGGYFNGGIDEFRVSNVCRWSAPFTPMGQNYNDVLSNSNDIATKLLMHFDGTYEDRALGAQGGGTQNVAIPTAHTFTAQGSISTTGSGKNLKDTTLLVNGTNNNRLLADATANDMIFGRSNFTIDFWLYKQSNVDSSIVSFRNAGSTLAQLAIQNVGGSLSFLASYAGSGWDINFNIGAVPTGVWTHIAVVRNRTIIQSYINGIAAGSAAIGAKQLLWQSSYQMTIGGLSDYPSPNGRIEELRISNVARWIANFAPYSEPYSPNAPGTPITIALTTPGSANWTVPANWNDANNSIEVIGAGGGGNDSGNNTVGWGGGGGAYSKITNLALSPGASIPYNVPNTTAKNANGGNTWFNGSALGAASVSAEGGKAGAGVGTSAGGQATNGIGTTKYSGGNGGGNSSGNGAGGGGGAAGPYNLGGNGGTGAPSNYGGGGGGGGGSNSGGQNAPSTTGGSGGQGWQGTGAGAGNGSPGIPAGNGTNGGGGGGSAGQSGTSNTNRGGDGGNGTEWGSWGSGGGGGGSGGGSGATTSYQGGPGGLFGGGGGGWGFGGAHYDSVGNGGQGGQGLIIIKYSPP